MKLLDRFFPSRAEIEALKAERDELTKRNEFLQQAEATSRSRESEYHQREAMLRTELRQTKEKLREQTDADLLLISQRITAKILEGDKPERDEIAEQQRLMAQRQSLAAQLGSANQMALYNGSAGLYGLSGILGGAFGFR